MFLLFPSFVRYLNIYLQQQQKTGEKELAINGVLFV